MGGFRKTREDSMFPLSKGEKLSTSAENITLGEMCLRRFLNRKEKRENGEIMKYLKSGAP